MISRGIILNRPNIAMNCIEFTLPALKIFDFLIKFLSELSTGIETNYVPLAEVSPLTEVIHLRKQEELQNVDLDT